jgi:hypothetical protein
MFPVVAIIYLLKVALMKYMDGEEVTKDSLE